MKFNQKRFENILIFGLVAACMFHPAASAAGLLILLASQMGDRYFTRNISDGDRQNISDVKSELAKITEQIQKHGLAKVFGGVRQ